MSLARFNAYVADSKVGRYFRLEERRTDIVREFRAGTVTFLTMSYILAVNALIISSSGGPCSEKDCTGPDITKNCKYSDPGYAACVEAVKLDIITATAAASCFGCLLMGLGANLPIATAPGLGLNAYFTFSVVGVKGQGNVSYGSALAAVFVEGWLFVLLALLGVRSKIMQLIPKSIMLATTAGIGLFLAFIGLETGNGLGVVTYSDASLVTLGGCSSEHQARMYIIPEDLNVCSINATTSRPITSLPSPSSTYACVGGKMTSPSTWLGIAGLAVIAIIMSRNVKGAVLAGISFVTIISWIPNHGASFLGAASPIPGGYDRMQYFKKFVQGPRLKKTWLAMDFSGFRNGNIWTVLLTFLYVDFLDTTGTLFSMAHYLNNYLPGFVGDDKKFERETFAFTVDGFASVAGSMMGSSPVTAYIESAAGIKEGGRTGITALVVAMYFLVCLFFNPIFASIPPYAVGPALVSVGALMMINMARIPWTQTSEAIPAFLTMILMPATYSIAYGVIAGIVSYIILYCAGWLLDRIEMFFRGKPLSPLSGNGSMHFSAVGQDSAIEMTQNQARPHLVRPPSGGALPKQLTRPASARNVQAPPAGTV